MTIIADILTSYGERYDNPEAQKELWRAIARIFPPKLNHETSPLPSRIIAREGGDLGLSLLWIVQASLIGGISGDIREHLDENIPLLEPLSPLSITALAHSDDRDRPMLLNRNGHGALSGRKRYITGGVTADCIMLTARERADEKISRLFLLQARDLPAGSLIPLEMRSLRTTCHASLDLQDYAVSREQALLAPGDFVRRSLKRWSYIERSMIMQALLGLACHINAAAREETGVAMADPEILEQDLTAADDALSRQIIAALKGGRIEESAEAFHAILRFIQQSDSFLDKHRDSLSANLTGRFADLNFMQKSRP